METEKIIRKIEEYWDKRSATFDDEHDTERLDVWKEFLVELLGDDRRKTVIDVGTGTGFLANMISELGFLSIGVDISEGMMSCGVRHADEKGLNTVFMRGNALNLPFMDGTADYIVNARLLWTLVEPEKAVREWNRVLKPGGKAFSFHRMKENVGMDAYKGYYDHPEVDDALTMDGAKIEALISLMENSGYEDVKIIKLPETAKDETVKAEEWYEPWFALCGTKPENGEKEL